MRRIFLDATRAYFEEKFLEKNLKNEDFLVMELPFDIGSTLTIEELRATVIGAYQPIIDTGIKGLYHINGVSSEDKLDRALLSKEISLILNNCYELIVSFDVITEERENSKIKIKSIKLSMYNFSF